MQVRTRRWMPVLLALGAGIVVGSVALPTASGEAATAKVYSLTVAGTDAHALDPHLQGAFVTGGGVTAVELPDMQWSVPSSDYLEVSLGLPVGAKVTSVAISYAPSEQRTFDSGTYTFGSYAPGNLSTQQIFTVSSPALVQSVPATSTNAVQGVTIAAGRRYVLDWKFPAFSTLPIPNGDGTFYGATVKYTCTAPCTP